MQQTLSSFQHHLGEISSEIEQLQSQSVSIAIELRNTTNAEKSLSQFLNHAYVAPDLINIILRDPFSEKLKVSTTESNTLISDLVLALRALSRKIYVQQLPAVRNTKAAQESEVLLEQLFCRAIAISQQGINLKISALKKPNVNIQMKQQLLVRLRPLYIFLLLHCGIHNPYNVNNAALDIRNNYIETLSNVYYQLFKHYITTTRAVQQDNYTTANDLLGVETRVKSTGFFGFGGGSSTAGATKATSSDSLSRLFSIGQRELTLSSIAKDAIILHVASNTNISYSYERLFKASLQLLTDTATAEAEFLWRFFGPSYDEMTVSTIFNIPNMFNFTSATNSTATGGSGSGGTGDSSRLSTSSLGNNTRGSSNHGYSAPTSPSSLLSPTSSLHIDDDDEDDDKDNDDLNADDSFLIPISEALGLVNLSTSLDSSKSTEGVNISKIESAIKQGQKNKKDGTTSPTEHTVLHLARTVKSIENEHVASAKSLTAQHAHTLFSSVFSKVMILFTNDLNTYLATTYDSIGVLIIIRMIYQANAELASRRLPHLNGLLDKLSLAAWQRFKVLFTANLESVKNVSLQSIKKGDIGIHFITQRYGEYASALYRLNTPYNDEYLTKSLSTLRLEIEVLFVRLAARVSSGDSGMTDSSIRDKRNKLIFLVNNFTALCRTFWSKQVTKAPEFLRFAELLNQSTSSYIEEELLEHFSLLINYVKDTESMLHRNSYNIDKVDVTKPQKVAQSFNSTWRESMKTIANNVKIHFASQNDVTLSSAPTFAAATVAVSYLDSSKRNTKGGTISTRDNYNGDEDGNDSDTTETETETEAESEDNEDNDENIANAAKKAQEEKEVYASVSALMQDLSGEVLKKMLLQLVVYYRRYLDLIDKLFPRQVRQPSFITELTSIQNVIYEIKKYGSKS